MWKNPNRIAVSQILAALLLLALAVAAAVLLYAYSIGLLGSLQGSGGQQMKQELILESYNWQMASVLVLTVRNVGSTAIDLAKSDFFINAQPVTWTMNCPSNLQPQGSCIVVLTVPNAVNVNGQAYAVKIVTADGAEFSYSAICGSTG